MMLKQTRRMSNTSTYIQEESFGKLVLRLLPQHEGRALRPPHLCHLIILGLRPVTYYLAFKAADSLAAALTIATLVMMLTSPASSLRVLLVYQAD
jgi:hypothetical protein